MYGEAVLLGRIFVLADGDEVVRGGCRNAPSASSIIKSATRVIERISPLALMVRSTERRYGK